MSTSSETFPGASGTVPVLVVRDPFDISWRERVAVLGPVVTALLAALVLGLLYAPDATTELLGLIPASIFAIGKFLPLVALSGKSHFDPWQLGFVIWGLDTWTVLVVVYGLEGLYRIGPLERTLTRVQTNASLVLAAYPRIRRAAVVGVVVFVLFPLAGTGALVGSFLGILLGLQRFVLMAAVSLGGLFGGMAMAFAAIYFGEGVKALQEAQSAPVAKWLIIAAVVATLVAAFWWLNRVYKRALDAARGGLEQADTGFANHDDSDHDRG